MKQLVDRHEGSAGASALRSLRTRLVAIVAGATLVAIVAAPATAAPVERTRSYVDCDGASVSLVMHPGWAAAVQWDISDADVENAPSYIATYIEGDVYLDGVYARSFTSSLGAMVGLGEPLSCTFEVHKPGFDVYGYTEIALIPAP
jgi:hypothetical protein